jgi:hypothetical protein
MEILMPMMLDQLRGQLSAIEPNETTYAGLSSSEIPLLQQLLKDPEPWMPARAIFALSRIADDSAVRVIRNAIADPRPEVRVAIAASAANLAAKDSNIILSKLLDDQDVGVRKFAVQSISAKNNPSIHAKRQIIETQDPVSSMRVHARLKRRELEGKPAIRPPIPPTKGKPFTRSGPRIKK